MQKLLSVKEAATILSITERAAWLRIYRNQLPHRRWGRKVIISLSELQKFIDALPGPTAEEAAQRAGEANR